jgi:hypothetical protein
MMKSLFLLVRACVAVSYIATAFIMPSYNLRTQYRFLRAKVYYPDDDHVNEDPASMDQAANIDIFNESPNSHLADRLFSNQDNASVLARLASAYSPPGYSIDLSSINNVRCLCVDNKHLEIEAVVCDGYECSSLLVPVDFPIECNLDYGLEDCVLNNVQNLDKQGDGLIQDRMHVFANEEEAQKAYEVFKLVGASDYLKPSAAKFPEWWIPPTSSEDVSECNMIETLLNEADWQLEMRELCKLALQQSGDAGFIYEEDDVQLALVKAIGPSGMVLEAHVSRGGRSVYDYGGMTNIAIVRVPIKFPLKSTGGNTSIRDHVLGIVSSVNV